MKENKKNIINRIINGSKKFNMAAKIQNKIFTTSV
jgi:hypothetical protein